MRKNQLFGTLALLAAILTAYQPWLVPMLMADEATPRAELISAPQATPSPARAGDTVTFNAAISAGGEAVQLSWDFGDGTSGDGPFAQHVYKNAGTYRVTVQGGGVSSSLNIDVQPAPILSLSMSIRNAAVERADAPGSAAYALQAATRKTSTLTISPFHILGVDVSALDLTQPTFVKFSKGSFNVTVPVMYMKPTSTSGITHIQAVVPPIISKGKPGSGSAKFTIIQGTGSAATKTKSSSLNILALPVAGASAPGSVLLLYLQAQQNAIVKAQASANANKYLSAAGSSALSTQASALSAMISKLAVVVKDPTQPFPFGTSTKADPKSLAMLDNLALGIMQGFTYSFASITPKAALRLDTQTIADEFNGLVSGIFGAGSNWWGSYGAFATIAGGVILLLGAAIEAPLLAAVGLAVGVVGLGSLCSGMIYNLLQYKVNGASLSAVVEESLSSFTSSLQQQVTALLNQISSAAGQALGSAIDLGQSLTQSVGDYVAQVPPPPPQSTFPTNLPRGTYNITVSTQYGTYSAGQIPNDGTAAFKNALMQVGAQFAAQSGGGVVNTVSYSAFNGTSFSMTYTSTATAPDGTTVSSSAVITATKV